MVARAQSWETIFPKRRESNRTPAPVVAPAETEQEAPTTIAIGSQTTEEALPLDRLVIDDRYQRNLKEAWVRHIAKNFDHRLFSKPLVARRPDGSYAVIDGQHRVSALRLRFGDGPITVLCDVIDAASVGEEADQFLGRNVFVKNPTAGEKFKARLASGDSSALSLVEIVRRHGFEVQLYSGIQKPGHFQSVSALVTIYSGTPYLGKPSQYARTGPDLLDATLGVIRDAWDGSTDGVGSVLLLGIATFLNRYMTHERFHRRRLIEVLRTVTSHKLNRDAIDAKILSGGGGQSGLARVILSMYNKRLGETNRLPEWADGKPLR